MMAASSILCIPFYFAATTYNTPGITFKQVYDIFNDYIFHKVDQVGDSKRLKFQKWAKMTKTVLPTLHPYNKAADGTLIFSEESSPSSSRNLPTYDMATQETVQ